MQVSWQLLALEWRQIHGLVIVSSYHTDLVATIYISLKANASKQERKLGWRSSKAEEATVNAIANGADPRNVYVDNRL